MYCCTCYNHSRRSRFTPAKPSTHKIYVDGERANVAAYEINDNNYFKLRDVAAILSGTDAQFEVTWDQATGNITLTDNQPIPR